MQFLGGHIELCHVERATENSVFATGVALDEGRHRLLFNLLLIYYLLDLLLAIKQK